MELLTQGCPTDKGKTENWTIWLADTTERDVGTRNAEK